MVRRYRRKAGLSAEEIWDDLDVFEDDDVIIVTPDDDDWPEGW